MELRKGLILGLAAIGLSGCATLHDFRLQAETYCTEFFTRGTPEFQQCTMLKTALIEQQVIEARRNMALGLSLGLQQFGDNMRMQAMQQQTTYQYQPPQTT